MTIQASLHILELDSAKDHDQLHRAYRRQVKRWHPDQFAHQPAIHAQAEERLKRINHAYSTLKEHLQKKASVHGNISTSKDIQAENGQQHPPPEPRKPIKRSPWFKPSHRNDHQKDDKSKSFRTSGAKINTAFVRKEASFNNILRKAAANPRTDPRSMGSGARSIPNPFLRKQRNKSMRIEGFRPAAPITPIKPISKIGKIEGSE